MRAIKIELNPSWNGNIYDISICIDAWIKLRTGLDVASYLKNDRMNRESYAIFIEYRTEEEKDRILELLRMEKSPGLISQIKEVQVYGYLNNRIRPDNTKTENTMSKRYYNAVSSWLITEIDHYEAQSSFKVNWSAHRHIDELTNIVSGMRFNTLT